MSFTQSLFQKKKANKGSISFGRKWLKLDEILVQNISFQQFDLLSFSTKALHIYVKGKQIKGE